MAMNDIVERLRVHADTLDVFIQDLREAAREIEQLRAKAAAVGNSYSQENARLRCELKDIETIIKRAIHG